MFGSHLRYLLILSLAFCDIGHAGFFLDCKIALVRIRDANNLASRVISRALENPQRIEEIPFGKVWAGYLKNVSQVDLQNPAEGNRPVPNQHELKKVLDFMHQTVLIFQTEVTQPSTPNPRGLKPIQTEVLAHLEGRLEKMVNEPSVQRAELMNVARLFSIAATQQLYLKENRTRDLTVWGDNAQAVLARGRGVTEADIDKQYGISALPLPTIQHLGFRAFLQIEGTGIVPLGVTAKRETVDGVILEPHEFFGHDDVHFGNRMGVRNDAFPVAMIGAAPVDVALNIGMHKAQDFSDSLIAKIDTLPSRRQQLMAEGTVFYIMHEENKSFGVLDFNSQQIKKRAKAILSQKKKVESMVINPFHDLIRRFGNEADFGQAFNTKPTAEEVEQTLRWLVAEPLTIPPKR